MMNLPMQESLCDSGKKTIMEKGNGSARKTSRVRKALRDDAVFDHLPLVKSIAVRVHDSLPVQVDLDDLIGAGILGLLDAASTNDPREKAIFHTYARNRIKVAILDRLRQADRVSRRGTERGSVAAREFPTLQEFQPDRMSAAGELHEMLMRAIETLPKRYQKVVILYYTNDMTMKKIGGLLGINESRVSQIHKTALEKMAIALQSAGIHLSAHSGRVSILSKNL